ncbi:zinc-binding dehydrogenase [Nakamurella sp. YIM 132087]|uniref:Zinc-binding dehydrogenase n=1 Tax=Nakamurella alba TaxID=2665158 RepID=A0A7K1FHI3_9ACTN|nr:zinc-binding alcohol dehydrogenase family protein [Nakamurella alba]MTD13581.1 zinc-binding dehydrogenase [Nakamurella alba]
MRALVVKDVGASPVVADFAEPDPGPDEIVVEMLAAGVHPIVRMIAAGRHYGSHAELPFVPGVDGIGRLPDGTVAYVGFARAPWGTLCERTVIPAGWSIPLPAGADPVVVAATMNPLAAVWMALVHRAALKSGERLLVLGATGASGRLAVQLAAGMGAGEVVAVGRNPAVLEQLGAAPGVTAVSLSDTDRLAGVLGEQGVDVVLDYLWGPPAETVIGLLTRTGLTHHATGTRWVQVGEMAGSRMTLDATPLRSSGLTLLGSGAGSVDPRVVAGAIPELLGMVASGSVAAELRAVPLADAGTAWDLEDPRRLVVTF